MLAIFTAGAILLSTLGAVTCNTNGQQPDQCVDYLKSEAAALDKVYEYPNSARHAGV